MILNEIYSKNGDKYVLHEVCILRNIFAQICFWLIPANIRITRI